MLTITNPEIVRALADVPGGLVPMYKADARRLTLIVKSMREVAVTAHVRRFFRVYLIPLRVGDVDTYGLVTAFFDDHDEPLTIRTPLFDEELTRDVFEVLSSDSFDIHFLTRIIANWLAPLLRIRMPHVFARQRKRFASCMERLISLVSSMMT